MEKMTEQTADLLKGNEALALAAIRYGCDGYFGYPITPQSEVLETLMAEAPWETTGMVVMQAESEPAAINMVYGGAACGRRVMTSSSGPGISLKQEGISYLAGAELPALIVNVMRGGPGLGTIQPSQADYFQAVKGGGHGDYRLIVLAPASVQDMADFVSLAFGSAARICRKTVDLARQRGVRLGLLRPVTLWPFPTQAIARLVGQLTSVLVVELNAGQMVEDVRLAAGGRVPVEHYGRLGGVVFSPDEILEAALSQWNKTNRK